MFGVEEVLREKYLPVHKKDTQVRTVAFLTPAANLKPGATQSPSGRPPALCQLPPETGMCKAIFHRFFYNATSDECEQFIYGGCQGNANNFKTIELCVRVCRPLVSPLTGNRESNGSDGMQAVKECW